jgi:hypothetical protein
MAANGISTLANKKLRQIAKLDLAQTRRKAGGDVSKPYYRALNTYELGRLPTVYLADNSLDDNPNSGGLEQGRPWVT